MNASIDTLKKHAGEYAALYIRSGMIAGLGAGSTARWALLKIAALIQRGEIEGVWGVPCSLSVGKKAAELNVPLASDELSEIDLTVDGADEINSSLDMIKGGGGAMLREKIVAQATKRMIIVIDDSKISYTLGKHPLPVEVSPFLWRSQAQYLETLDATVRIRRNVDNTIWLTDQKT